MMDTSLLSLTPLPPLTHSLRATRTAYYGWVRPSSISSFYMKLPNSCQVIGVRCGFNSRITGRKVVRPREDRICVWLWSSLWEPCYSLMLMRGFYALKLQLSERENVSASQRDAAIQTKIHLLRQRNSGAVSTLSGMPNQENVGQ